MASEKPGASHGFRIGRVNSFPPIGEKRLTSSHEKSRTTPGGRHACQVGAEMKGYNGGVEEK